VTLLQERKKGATLLMVFVINFNSIASEQTGLRLPFKLGMKNALDAAAKTRGAGCKSF